MARKRTHGTRKSRKRGRSSEGNQSYGLTVVPLEARHPDPEKQRALVGFLEHGNIRAGCLAANIGRTTWYQWIKHDPEFARLASEAEEHVTDELEKVAHQRAKDPVNGSDTLLIFLLKSRRRGKYADRELITTISPEVQMRVQAQLQLIAKQVSWNSEELITALGEIWK